MKILRVAALVLTAVTASPSLQAHEADALLPENPGLLIGVSIAGGWLNSDRPTPVRRLTAVTSLGDTPDDARGWQVEHATAGVGIRWLPRLSTALVVGWHGSGDAHVEAAWLQLDIDDPLAEFDGERNLALGLGRNRMPTGDVIGLAGHLDRIGQMPLAKRATFNGDWIDDGINLRWQPHLAGALGWLDRIDLGFWRAQRFPGAPDAPVAPSLHVGTRIGELAIDGFLTRLRPEGRGAYVQREGSGHIHTAPRCDAGLRDIVCFDGRVDLAGLSFAWATPWPMLALQGAVISRRERGELYSANGEARYRGRSTGGWLDLIVTPAARWELTLRHEWLRGHNTVAGIGATRVATDANLLPADPARRTTLAIAWQAQRDWRVAVEAGRESVAGERATIVGLRVLWSPRPWALPRAQTTGAPSPSALTGTP